MKRNFTLLFILSIVAFHIKAQTFEWLKTVDVEYEFNPEMIQYNTAANPLGGCYFFGIQDHVTFYNESMGVLFLKKYSQEGTETWSRAIFGQSAVKGMVSNSYGDVFISGQILADADFWGVDTLIKTGIGTDGFVARVSAAGDLTWSINLTGLPMGEGTVSGLALHNDMLYVAYSNWMNSYVLIFNEDGQYMNSVLQEDVSVIAGLDFDLAGNLFVSGGCAGWQATFGGVPYPAPFSYTTYVAKYNSSFEPEWVKYIEDITCTFPQVKADDEGWAYFAGQLFNETLFDTIPYYGPEWTYDFFLARINPEGQFQWVRECPEVLTGDATIGSMHFLDIDTEGNALLTGITRGFVDWGNGVISDISAGNQDLIVWNFSPEGHVNWVKTAGGEGYELTHSIAAGPDGSAYLAGLISGSVVFDTITHESDDIADPFLAKLNLDILSGAQDHFIPAEVEVYPNPASDRIYIHSYKELDSYRLYNSIGMMVQSGALSGQNQEINLTYLPGGLYLLALEDEQAKVFARIIVK